MAAPLYDLRSQTSSSNALYTHRTPSETWPTQSGSMPDLSQFDVHTNPEDFGALGGNVPYELPLMDVEVEDQPGTVAAFNSYPPDMTGLSAAENQQQWAAIGLEQVGSPGQYPNSEVTIDSDGVAKYHGQRIILAENNAGPSHVDSYAQNQWLQNHLAALDHCISGAEHQSSNLTLAVARPRYIPDGALGPWSAFMASEQITDTHPVSELMYDPATDHEASGPVDQRSGHGVNFPRCLPSNDPMDTDGSSDYALSPNDRIDPPAGPDPVGPPLEAVDGDRYYCGQLCPTKPSGGRRHGPLNPQSRENAKIARRKGPCWPCILQRNQCEFEDDDDDMCKGCKHKRKQSLIPGCPRFRLPDLIIVFIPSSLAEQHDPEKLRAFAKGRCDATEIESNGPSLCFQNQFRLNLATDKYELVKVPSPPLGMVLLSVGLWRRRLNEYLEELLEKRFWGFPEVCFRGDDCRVAKDFLIPIFKYHEAATDSGRKLVHQSLKLVVLTHIMTHSLTLVESTKDSVYQWLQNPPHEQFSHHTCPRWLNKQIKFLLSTLHRDVLQSCLSMVQEKLRTSRRKPVWAALFTGMLVLAMTTETQGQTLRCKERTEKEEGTIRQEDTTADDAIRLMDERFGHLKNIFHQGYRSHLAKGFNPLRSRKDRDFLEDEASRSLAAKANKLVNKHNAFLVARQVLPPPSTPSDPQTGRLVAQFLLGFAPPAKQHLHQPAVPSQQ
ncbi:MAG: hypothetical protein Q9193_002722 [Seirophora villosa]